VDKKIDETHKKVPSASKKAVPGVGPSALAGKKQDKKSKDLNIEGPRRERCSPLKHKPVANCISKEGRLKKERSGWGEKK